MRATAPFVSWLYAFADGAGTPAGVGLVPTAPTLKALYVPPEGISVFYPNPRVTLLLLTAHVSLVQYLLVVNLAAAGV